ncbi:MAG TPA: O-antigen ligase family protein [Candidatus Nitrosocosmicus sp.]|nr:O-antigen ligase family protein [Candidatus Nitrosocosmicus sp.]
MLILLLFRVRLEINNLEKSLIGLIFIFFLSLLNGFWQFTWQQNLVGVLYLLRMVIYLLFLIFLLKVDVKLKDIIGKAILLIIFLTSVFSLLQYFFYPDLRNLYYLGWDPHLSRIFAPFFDSSITGIIYVLLFFWLSQKKFKWSKYIKIKYFILFVIFMLILLTYSRIAYIGFIIGTIYYLNQKISKLKIFGLIALFTMLLFFLPRPFGESVKLERLFTIEARAKDYKSGLELFVKRPILGYGYNRLKYVRDVTLESHAGSNFSSSYLTILVSTGIIGIFVFMYFLYNFYMYLNTSSRGLLIILAGTSFLDNLFLTNFVLLVFILLVSNLNSKKVS